MISKVATQGSRQGVLEHFKGHFCAAIGTTHVRSSNEGWAETDLTSFMHNASENAPLFIEAFFDACESLRNHYPEWFVPRASTLGCHDGVRPRILVRTSLSQAARLRFRRKLALGLVGRIQTNQVENDLLQEGEILWSVVLAHGAGIFAEADVEHPVKSVASRPEELHPRPLTERCVNLSIHTAPIKQTHRPFLSANARRDTASSRKAVRETCSPVSCGPSAVCTSSSPKPPTSC
jgi:hypothetical protein